jgi:hypothetical protein
MAKTWQRMDLAGGGLQAANLRLARQLNKRRIAYAALVLFPLGLHRLYLRDPHSSLCYLTASPAGALLYEASQAAPAFFLALLIAAAGITDTFRIERRLVSVDKQLRKEVFLAQTATPAPSDRVRPVDPVSSPSFVQQERLLAEIARRRNRH